MKLHSRSVLIAVAFAMLLCLVDKAQGCSCAGPLPPCQAYGAASAVFVGAVTDVSMTSIKFVEGEKAQAFRQRLIRFSVEQALRGVDGKEVAVVTGLGDGDCGYEFKQGERYMVYANRSAVDGRLVTTICSRTRPVSQASEDLEYIRGLSSAEPGGRIYGTIQQYTRKPGNNHQVGPVAGVKVIIEGQDQHLEVLTDDKGHYQAVALKPGTYHVRAILPEQSTSNQPREVEVADRGCAQVDFHSVLDR